MTNKEPDGFGKFLQDMFGNEVEDVDDTSFETFLNLHFNKKNEQCDFDSASRSLFEIHKSLLRAGFSDDIALHLLLAILDKRL